MVRHSPCGCAAQAWRVGGIGANCADPADTSGDVTGSSWPAKSGRCISVKLDGSTIEVGAKEVAAAQRH